MHKAPKDVDAYIAAAPREVRGTLKSLREAIREAAPGAEERISYGMPFYEYRGRLVYFSLWKRHVGMYAITAPVLTKHRSELKGYITAKGALRFPLDVRLPLGLIKKLVRAQMKENARKK